MPKAPPEPTINIVTFNQQVKHPGTPNPDGTGGGLFNFFQGQVVEFEDPDAGPYFVRCGWAAPTPDASPQLTVTEGELNIDPETRHNERAMLVRDVVVGGATEMEA